MIVKILTLDRVRKTDFLSDTSEKMPPFEQNARNRNKQFKKAIKRRNWVKRKRNKLTMMIRTVYVSSALKKGNLERPGYNTLCFLTVSTKNLILLAFQSVS